MTIEKEIQKFCIKHKKTLSLAESCTGGQVASRLTSIPGASDYFAGGLVCYTNDVKLRILDVPYLILEEHGAVSEAVAESMALKARALFKTDYALATTGFAGPKGGTPDAPLGTVFIALAKEDKCSVIHKHFKGKRESIIEQATNEALIFLHASLNK